ncbi:MAG TPA: 2-polyprenyl-3-methyl-6-methoxy-1,4-benzoquinone monooxygenase [Thiobacillus sp.]|jgi:ubiquinone biosynthesis monooxygenase Coq7|nr:2-polyprenyl-3-methyl-6-methoxy-1,4-benzoquinone monooxygenase [Gammaproteobacteria bacterium]OYZ27190.1 MAG: demethoxyubiquinone hydroxylase family protein [Hydrogenophilales bacterium 16-64-40]OZA33087.1 MAG: demethoxyubiquinone hydroxylase family protein [Hydrogenophilales bacterium 17-64-65]HQS81609.1 2-polyprenyl-3-methyl-6-methoxy-1,4-benzoquinone monooxygenase [Thiobacillus sp.]HQT34810.1 2-polyprenyl-3-methyl-6-methoxy-1,4-benzoquinone monooxygenase [Thiobacillus sp.]
MNRLDQLIITFDLGLRTVFATPHAGRPYPGTGPESELSDAERAQAAALMRVNHVGEVCAQALYAGQALTAKNGIVRAELEQAAREETDHLAWCEQRIVELGGRKSLLNPLWFGGAFGMGVVAGMLGDKWNLGFLAETERQVEAHLDGHLQQLPQADAKSRAVVEQMKTDEARHAQTAVEHGGAALPQPVKRAMQLAANVMRQTASRI